MITQIRKRDGIVVDYDKSKIVNAIYNAAQKVGGTDISIAELIANKVEQRLIESSTTEIPSVDEIQDLVERTLIKQGYADTAKEYILYRNQRDRVRDSNSQLISTIRSLTIQDSSDMDLKRENANIDGDATMGIMLRYGSETSKRFTHLNLLRPEISKAHLSGLIHIHDLDFYPLTINCMTGDTEIEIRDYTGKEQKVPVSYFDQIFLNTGRTAVNMSLFNMYIKSYDVETDLPILTKIKTIMRRPIGSFEQVYVFTIGNNKDALKLTGNHIVPVMRDNQRMEIKAKFIKTGDMILSQVETKFLYFKVTNIDSIKNYTGFVYDIETENHLFLANNYVVHNCIQMDLAKLFKNGFSTGHGKLREPSDIRSAASLAAIAIQSDQNDMFGGQSIAKFDYDLAKYVAYTFINEMCKILDLQEYNSEKISKFKEQVKEYINEKTHILNKEGIDFIVQSLYDNNIYFDYISNIEDLLKKSYKYTNKTTYQAMEGFIHNMNTLHCLPASEKIWVFDKEVQKLFIITMEDLCNKFSEGRFQAVSLNVKNRSFELKDILDIQRKNNHRNLTTLITGFGQRVTVTDNHFVYTVNQKSKIIKKYPGKINNVLCPAYPKLPNVNEDSEFFSFNEYKYLNEHTVIFGDIALIPVIEKEGFNSGEEYVYDLAVQDNENFLTKDFIVVSNSRAGAQVPFSSINYGTDTSIEGRLISKNIMLATQAGLGDGETAIFPVQIFKVKDGVNGEPQDPNYDLFKLACSTSAKRLFPNFCFIDAPYNLKYYDKDRPETEACLMGCRTRVIANIHDPSKEIFTQRGNLSFTSINLPRLGIMANHDINRFFESLDNTCDLVIQQLLDRFEVQAKRKAKNMPFSMLQNVYLDSEKLNPDDEIREIIKHGTLTIGFIGLAECLVALIGKHHGESEEAQELGLKIIGHIRKRTDEATEKYKLNFSCIGTPGEGLCLSGNTLVNCVNGYKLIKDVKKGDLIYTYNEKTKKIEIDEVIKSGKTSDSRKVMRIYFDTGQSVICTPNHPFAVNKTTPPSDPNRLNYIEWVEAKDLKIGFSIKSAYIQESGSGHLKYTVGGVQFLHKMIYEYISGKKIPKGYVVHHIDGNKKNNEFKNLELMTSSEHKRLHLKDNIGKYCYTRENSLGEKNIFYGKHHSDESKQKISATKKSYRNIPVPEEILVNEYNLGLSVMEVGNKYGIKYWTIRSILLENGVKFRKNHKVTKIEFLKEPHAVYDITMKNNHNFFIGGDQGILVHNSGRFVSIDKRTFGIIKGVTDREYYTNSSHVPVYYPISMAKKIDTEAPYHAFENGGAIAYVEMDGDIASNPEAFEQIIQYMKKAGIGYGSVNHAGADRDPVCGYVGIIGDICPRCGRRSGEPISIDLLEKYKNIKYKVDDEIVEKQFSEHLDSTLFNLKK